MLQDKTLLHVIVKIDIIIMIVILLVNPVFIHASIVPVLQYVNPVFQEVLVIHSLAVHVRMVIMKILVNCVLNAH